MSQLSCFRDCHLELTCRSLSNASLLVYHQIFGEAKEHYFTIITVPLVRKYLVFVASAHIYDLFVQLESTLELVLGVLIIQVHFYLMASINYVHSNSMASVQKAGDMLVTSYFRQVL